MGLKQFKIFSLEFREFARIVLEISGSSFDIV